jgi:hypothetical protein
VGVFVSFTLSQSGMVRHWLRERVRGWRWKLGLNALGAVLTGIVLVVVLISKAPASLLVAVIIPCLVGVMLFIQRQYHHTAEQLAVKPNVIFAEPRKRQRVVIPVPALTRAVVQAVQVGRALTDDVQLVHVTEDIDEGERVRATYERQFPGIQFTIVESPFRALVQPFVTYLDVSFRDKETMTIVIVPEFVARHWWEQILYNQTARRLRQALIGRTHTVVMSVPYRREKEEHPVAPAP